MVFPVHAARRLGLGRAAASGAHRRCMAGPASQAAPARESERVLLRAGSHERRAAAGAGVRQKPDLGPRDWKRRTPGAQPGPGTDPHGHEGVSCRRGRDQLVFDRVQPRNWSLLVQTLESCSIYTRAPDTWRPGRSSYAGSTRQPRGERGQKFLRAIEIQSGAIAWELPQTGPANSWGGVLASAGGLVFFGEDSGALMAVDARRASRSGSSRRMRSGKRHR